MQAGEWVLLAYAGLYLSALGLAARRKDTFPWSESILILLIVGFGFSGLVYWVTGSFLSEQPAILTPPSEPVFTGLYVAAITILLIFRPAPEGWRGQFLKKRAAALIYKLPIFVLIPLGVMRGFFHWTWADLGFSTGDVTGQLTVAGILILIFAGFNLLVGNAAAPIRKGLFPARQVGLGFGWALGWNVLETGLVEEFFFRAFLQTQLIHMLSSPLAGICLVSLVFGLAHAPGIYLRSGDQQGPLGERPSLVNTLLYAVIVLSTAGWFTGILYWRTQSLLAPILVHAAIDAVAHTPEFIHALRLAK